MATLTQEQADAADFSFKDPAGPSFDAELVGIFRSAYVLESEYSVAVFGPELLDIGVPVVTTNMYVDLHQGRTLDQLRAQLDALDGGAAFTVAPSQVVNTDIRNAVDAQAQSLWLMAVVSAVAAVVALGQLLTRHVRLGPADRHRLLAVGYTDGQLRAESLVRATVPAGVGVAAGAVLAVVASGWFPTGFVRFLEPDPGRRIDVVALAVGGAVLLVAILAWVGAASLVAARNRTRRSPSRSTEMISRRAPTPAAAIGTRFALTRHDGSSGGVISQLALAVLVGGAVGATIFGASVNDLVSDHSRFGSDYDFAIGLDHDELSPSDLRGIYEDEPDVDGLMILTGEDVRVGDTTVGLVGIERVRGEIAPPVVAGRLPQGADEVALGRLTARHLDVGVGDSLDFVGADGNGTYRVVGVAVVPPIGGIDGVGQGGVVTSEGLLRLQSDPASDMAAIALRPGTPAGAVEQLVRLVEPEGDLEQFGSMDTPSSILNVTRVRHIPMYLAMLVGALMVLTLVHGLIVSIQRRRQDLAVLRALGGDRRFITGTVHWQATALTALPLALGLPLGLIVGSVVYRVFADRIGAVPDATRPIVVIVATVLALVAVANVGAIVPARRARSMSTAQQLRTE